MLDKICNKYEVDKKLILKIIKLQAIEDENERRTEIERLLEGYED